MTGFTPAGLNCEPGAAASCANAGAKLAAISAAAKASLETAMNNTLLSLKRDWSITCVRPG